MNSDESNGHDLDEKDARKVSVMLVDNDPTFLQIVVASLQTHHREQLDVVGTARSTEECLIQAQVLAPKVVLMELEIPGHGGLWAIPLLRILFPETRVIALTHNDGADARRAVLAAGGNDLVSKAAWQTDLIPAIQRAVEWGDQQPSPAVTWRNTDNHENQSLHPGVYGRCVWESEPPTRVERLKVLDSN